MEFRGKEPAAGMPWRVVPRRARLAFWFCLPTQRQEESQCFHLMLSRHHGDAGLCGTKVEFCHQNGTGLDLNHSFISTIIVWLWVSHFALGLSFCVSEVSSRLHNVAKEKKNMNKLCAQGCVQNHFSTVNKKTDKLRYKNTEQWFLIFLTLQPFNRVHVAVIPNYKIIFNATS